MPTSPRVTVPFFRAFAPLLALTFAGCSYHYHSCSEQGHEHHQHGPATPPAHAPMPMAAMNGAPQQQHQPAQPGPQHDHRQRDEERAANDRVNRELHQHLDRLSERLTRLEKLLEQLSKPQQQRR